MTDTDKLKRLAEAAREFEKFAAGALSCAEYLNAATPKTILALIAENERLAVRVSELDESLLNMKMVGDALMAGLTASQATEILHSEYFARITGEK